MSRARILALILLLSAYASASCTTGVSGSCEVGSGKTYSTISLCTAAMSAGQTCLVFAGTYVENVTVPAGTSGNFDVLTVNGSDQVQITGHVVLNSYDKLVGNCPALQGTVTTLTCGFFITSTASGYISTPCISVNGGSTFFYIQNVTTAFCQGIAINRGTSPHTTHGFIQQNTISYPGTQASVCPPNAGACNVAVAMPLSCDYCLVEKNDVSHTADWDNEYDGSYNFFRGNSFHDNSQTECLTGTHGDQCHIDFVESEPGASSYPTEYTVVEKNTENINTGSNGHGFLFQGDTCSGNCFDVIVRFNQVAHVGGGGLLDDLGGFYNVHLYNNTWIDMTQNGLSGGITNHWKSASSGGSAVNELFYYPSAVSNFNAIACEDTSCTGFNHGHNLGFCGPFGGSSTCPSGSSGLLGYQYGTGAWLSDTGNLLTDPKITSYSSTGIGNPALQSTSPARNAGISLTTVNGTTTSSTSLVVNDAHYFQDGHGITGVQGDCIAVTTISNHVCITAVNYSTNTLTLASAISATNGDPVWIYSISDGTQVLTDSTGPDMGAVPFTPSVSCGPPNYRCSNTGTTVYQTPNNPPFKSPSSSGTTCTPGSANFSGNGCAGSVGYDTSGLNASGLDPYLRVSDNAAISGRSCGSTFSGGDNDEAWSCTGRTDTSVACSSASLYLTTCASPSGGVYVAGVKINGSVPQLVAPLPTSSTTGHPSPGGAISFGNQDPLTAYVMSTESDPKLYKVVYAWDGTIGHALTLTQTQLVDVGATCPLPNGTSFNTQATGGASHDINDNIFASDFSNVAGVSLGTDTATVTNGSTAFTLTGAYSMATDGSLVHAVIKLGGVSYTIATVTSGTTGTLTANYAGTSGSGVSVAIPSGQGTAIYEAFIQLSPSGCIVLNTYTGTFAANGAFASLNGQSWDSSCSGVYIHDGFMLKDGSYMQISGANTGTNCGTVNIFYQIGTTHLVPCTATRTPGVVSICQGHQGNGYHNIITGTGPWLVNFAPANASSATPTTGFVALPASGSYCDTHFSWRNATSGDTQPITFQTTDVNYSSSGTGSSWTLPGQGELGAAAQSGTLIRFGHTFGLGAQACDPSGVGPFDSNVNFEAQNAIGVVSQDGKLMSYASSMLGQLGSDTNGQTYRSDLIVVGLDMKGAGVSAPTSLSIISLNP